MGVAAQPAASIGPATPDVYPRQMPPTRDATELVFLPADRVRLQALRALGPVARRLVRDRELRVALVGALAVITALLATLLVPWWLLALGPVVLGVPHILADVRYLVIRPGFHRRWGFWLLVAAPIAATWAGAGLRAGTLGVAGAALLARGAAWWARALVVACAAALCAVAWGSPWWTDLSFAHAHNLVALALWWAWRPRTSRWHLLPLVSFVGALALLAAGSFETIVYRSPLFWSAPDALDATVQVPWLASRIPGEWALRLTLSFAFAQSVHYAVWLRMVPEDDRGRDTPRPFAASWRALTADVGRPLLALTALATLGLVGWALADIAAARDLYLRVGLFHGHLELAAFVLFLLEGARSARATA